MDIVTPDQLEAGDIVQGPDGPEQVTEKSATLLHFKNKDHCMAISPRTKIMRHVKAEVLKQAGVLS